MAGSLIFIYLFVGSKDQTWVIVLVCWDGKDFINWVDSPVPVLSIYHTFIMAPPAPFPCFTLPQHSDCVHNSWLTPHLLRLDDVVYLSQEIQLLWLELLVRWGCQKVCRNLLGTAWDTNQPVCPSLLFITYIFTLSISPESQHSTQDLMALLDLVHPGTFIPNDTLTHSPVIGIKNTWVSPW